MPLGAISFSGDIDLVTTDQLYPLGFMVTLGAKMLPSTDANKGDQTWIYVQMTGAPSAVGSVLSRAAGSETYVAVLSPTSTQPARVVGVAQHIIAQDSFGWVLRDGVGEVLADATGFAAADLGLIIDASTAGCATTAAASTADVFGTAIDARVGAGLATCRVACRG